MYAFSHIRSFSLTSRSPKTRPKPRVILPKRPKPKKPKKGQPVQSLVQMCGTQPPKKVALSDFV